MIDQLPFSESLGGRNWTFMLKFFDNVNRPAATPSVIKGDGAQPSCSARAPKLIQIIATATRAITLDIAVG